MDLKFGEEQVRAVVTKAIIESLGEEQKTLILTQAVEHLMRKRNHLQRAFGAAAERALAKLADEEMQKPENVEKLRGLLGPVLVEALAKSASYDKIRRALADALVRAFADSKD